MALSQVELQETVIPPIAPGVAVTMGLAICVGSLKKVTCSWHWV
jgi:hypothetical protein